MNPNLDSATERHPSVGRRTATAEAAVVEQAARARRAAIERPRGHRRRSAAPPYERGLASAPLRRGHAGGARFYEMAATAVAAVYFLQHNYPVACTRAYFLQGIMVG